MFNFVIFAKFIIVLVKMLSESNEISYFCQKHLFTKLSRKYLRRKHYLDLGMQPNLIKKSHSLELLKGCKPANFTIIGSVCSAGV